MTSIQKRRQEPLGTAFDTEWLDRVGNLKVNAAFKIALVVGRFQAEGQPATVGTLHDRLGLDPRTIRTRLAALVHAGLLAATDEGWVTGPQYRPPYIVRETRQAIRRQTREEVDRRDGGTCTSCGGTEHLSLDHVVPWSRGGSDDAPNLVLACRSCNSSKNAKTPAEWRGEVN